MCRDMYAVVMIEDGEVKVLCTECISKYSDEIDHRFSQHPVMQGVCDKCGHSNKT